MIHNFKQTVLIILFMFSECNINAQFYDDFKGDSIKGWFSMTGDGNAVMQFVQEDDFASIIVDATADRYNVYWALIKQDVTNYLDLSLLKDTSFQLRVEARVRIHNAPRRVNFMVNTQRTVNYHIDLMEYDLQDTNTWYTISMTTKRFDAVPGDRVFVQLAATDFGTGKYTVDVDYYRADIINIKEAEPDKGPRVPYHPTMPGIDFFNNHVMVTQDCLIHSDFPDVNFNNWTARGKEGSNSILTVHANQWIIMRWDLADFKSKPTEAGILELTTHAVSAGGNYNEVFGEDLGMEFGKVRVVEILGGDPAWDQKSVTFRSLTEGQHLEKVFNGQMIFDAKVNELQDGKTHITLSKYVLQRLFDGTTKGLLIKPLGAIDASFYSSESGKGPVLHLNAE
jgi:hypothetical protein